MAHHLKAGEIIKSGHRMVVVLQVADDRVLARDADGDEGWIPVFPDTKVAGREGDGLYAYLALVSRCVARPVLLSGQNKGGRDSQATVNRSGLPLSLTFAGIMPRYGLERTTGACRGRSRVVRGPEWLAAAAVLRRRRLDGTGTSIRAAVRSYGCFGSASGPGNEA